MSDENKNKWIDDALNQQFVDSIKLPQELLESPPLKIETMINGMCSELIQKENELILKHFHSINVDPDIVMKQAEEIKDLKTTIKTLTNLIESDFYIRRPCALGTTVYCVINGTIVEGVVSGYEEVFNTQKREVYKFVNISLVSTDGIIKRVVSGFGKTIFLSRAEAEQSIK